MTDNEKKYLKRSIFTIIFCILFAVMFVVYVLLPRDTLSKEIKEYYISGYTNNYESINTNIIALDSLIKKGYVEKKEELDKYECDYKYSYIKKENETVTLVLNCKKYTKDYSVILGGNENDNKRD